MKTLPRILLLVLPLVALLTWLLLHSVGPRGRDYVWAQRDVARVSLAEAALRGDTLQARIGLLSNYDPLVDDMEAFSGAVDELARQAMVRREDAPLMTELKHRVREDGAALEQFKSDNALLQNSLIYFNVLDDKLATSSLAEPMTGAIDRLGSAILEFSRNPTPSGRAEIDARLDLIDAIAGASHEPAPSRDLTLLLTHGRLLARLLPAIDGDLRTLFAVSTETLRDRIRTSQDARRIHEENRAAHYRLALYGASVILLAVLTQVGLQRRAGLQLLRRHAEIEALLGDTSTRFLAMGADEYGPTMHHALSQLGTAFEADRVRLLELAHPERVISWCAPGTEASATSGEALLDTILAEAVDADELLDVPLVGQARPGPLVDALRRAGIAGWYGIMLRVDDRHRALLSFERIRTARAWPPGGTGSLRRAAEVVQGALDRRHALIQRTELEARLGRGRRLEAVGIFASGIAHNFNNMIGAILGHAEMAEEASANPGRAEQHIGEIRHAGERAQQLVGKILDFGARRTTPLRAVPVDRLLLETASMLRVTLPAHVGLVVEPQAPGGVVQGDLVQLQQVIMNLVRNGAQAMTEPGTITVRADALRLAAPQALSHDTVRAGDYVRIAVIDTGSGMDAATLANIFQPFFTTRPAGTGLGLATVREIVYDHDGAVDVRSLQHRGSTFAIWLPAGQPDAERLPDPRDRTGKTILLLAPSRSTVLNDEEMLAALGYEPVGFDDAEAAMEAARSQPGRFDAVMVDPSSLDAAGRVLLRRLREELPLVPLVLVTAGPVTESPSELADLGVSLHTRRPIRSSAIAAALADCMDAAGRRGWQ